MRYQSAQQAAERLNVTTRAVQKWAKEGKIPGAYKHGRDWMIPENCHHPGSRYGINEEGVAIVVDTPLPFMQIESNEKSAKEYISSIEDAQRRDIALGEYYYYKGYVEKASEILEPYFYSDNPANRCTALLISAFANLLHEHINKTEMCLTFLQDILQSGFKTKSTDELYALGSVVATTVAVQLHDDLDGIPDIENYVKYLNEALKLFACYLMAHKVYLQRDYSRSLGIANTALMCNKREYAIPMAYLHLMAAIDLINMHKNDEALKRLEMSWELVKSESFIMLYVEHYNMMCGMCEAFFKQKYPEVYAEIISLVKTVSVGLSKIHNKRTGRTVALNLTAMEFTIAMLFSRGWRTKEIAAHMQLSESTIKNNIQRVYEKLSINSRRDLEQYMTK